jgi:hypothetical protein
MIRDQLVLSNQKCTVQGLKTKTNWNKTIPNKRLNKPGMFKEPTIKQFSHESGCIIRPSMGR